MEAITSASLLAFATTISTVPRARSTSVMLENSGRVPR